MQAEDFLHRVKFTPNKGLEWSYSSQPNKVGLSEFHYKRPIIITLLLYYNLADTATTAGAAADKAASNNKEATSLYQLPWHRVCRDLEPSSSKISAGAGPTNDSRQDTVSWG